MSVRNWIRGSAIALLLSVPGFCLAAGNALIVHDGTAGIEADALGNVTAKLVAAGYVVTPNVGVPGGSLATYQQIWDIRFNNPTPISPSDSTAYLTFLSGGGRLFLDGENVGFATRNASIVAFITAAGGGTTNAITPANLETVMPPFNGPNAITQITFLAAAGSSLRGTGDYLTVDGSLIGAGLFFPPGTLASAPAGTLLVLYDVNFLQAGANPESQALIANMIGYMNAPFAVTQGGLPTLSTWALILLGLALAAVGVRFLHSRSV